MSLLSRQRAATTGRLSRRDDGARFPAFGVPRPNMPIPSSKQDEEKKEPKKNSSNELLGMASKAGIELGKLAVNKLFGNEPEKPVETETDPLAGLRASNQESSMQRFNSVTQSPEMTQKTSELSNALGFTQGGENQQSEGTVNPVNDFYNMYNAEHFNDQKADANRTEDFETDFSGSAGGDTSLNSGGGGGK